MLDEAEANIEQLDSNSLKQLLLSFEKKITKNLKMRMKNSEDPEKFMESELELHAEINELYAVAASPELYPTFVEAGSVTSVLGIYKCIWTSRSHFPENDCITANTPTLISGKN